MRLAGRLARPLLALVAGLMLLAAAGARAEAVRIPDVPPLYRLAVEREAADVWGIDAPTARIAAQIHQESRWNPKAASAYAHGLAQFTPGTAKWIAQKFPAQLGQFDPWDAMQAVRAMVLYDHYLLTRNPGASACDSWAFALAAYNGGEAWLRRDQRLAAANAHTPSKWFGEVEDFTARAKWAKKENREYVSRILLVLEPAYADAGWSNAPACVEKAP